mmetsp:Transcript_24027/g.43437  ORF Transcript_24027/g.43437 Transcript_24027/m.43437 type:complete len:387 (-) Transcript_24027:303-1463(-)
MAIRQRKKDRSNDRSNNQKNPPPSNQAPTPKDSEEVTAWETISRHPAVLGLVFLGIPYAIYCSYFFLLLQKPHWISNDLLRPAVSMADERQVLIVGTMSSGTTQITHELHDILNLEVGHEDSDTNWKFVRDGSISWFHGIRFFPAFSEHRRKVPVKLCRVANQFITSLNHPYAANPGLFTPPQYEVSHLHPNFSKYWFKECVRIMWTEYGCASRGDCPTPFRKTLIQTRKPTKIVESLVAKYCKQDGSDTIMGMPPTSLIEFLDALFPEHNFASLENTCTSIMANYVLLYYNMLLDAYDRGDVDGMYHIEDVTLCDVAQFSGLLNKTDTVFGPNYEFVSELCNGDNAPGLIGQHRNVINQGRVKIFDLQDKDLEKRMLKLHKRMGY